MCAFLHIGVSIIYYFVPVFIRDEMFIFVWIVSALSCHSQAYDFFELAR